MSDVTPSQDRLAARLFERHGRHVRQYLRGLSGSADVAEDLAQDVFLRVVRGANEYRPQDRERPWLFRIARNAFIDHVRRVGTRPATAALESADGTARAATQDLRVELRRALAELPENERDAFLLAEIGGLSYAEIAETLGVTIPSVRSSIYRARLALRAALARPRPLDPPIHAALPTHTGGKTHDD